MQTKIIVCESCEAEFKIQHDLDSHYYSPSYCPFCSEPLNSENEDEIEELDEEYDEPPPLPLPAAKLTWADVKTNKRDNTVRIIL